MILFIFLAIMTTLAVSQGLLLLFLIRSRVHMLHLAQEIIKLQDISQRIQTESTVVKLRIQDFGENDLNEAISSQADPGLAPLAAVGS